MRRKPREVLFTNDNRREGRPEMTQAEQDALKDVSDIRTLALGSLFERRQFLIPKPVTRLLPGRILYDRLQTEKLAVEVGYSTGLWD